MKKSMLGCVDSIDEGIAKIAFESDEKIEKNMFVPVEFLPSGVKEGSWLSCTFKLDKDAEASSKKKVAELLKSISSAQDCR